MHSILQGLTRASSVLRIQARRKSEEENYSGTVRRENREQADTREELTSAPARAGARVEADKREGVSEPSGPKRVKASVH